MAMVLIVDDEDHVRELLKVIVSSIGFQVIGEASDGEEAIVLFKERKPDILLLDINLPLKTGEEVLQQIDTKSAAIIMLTSISYQETVKNCIRLWALNYIRKDMPLNEIGNMINKTYKTFLANRNKSL